MVQRARCLGHVLREGRGAGPGAAPRGRGKAACFQREGGGASLGLHNPERGGGVPMVLLRGYGKVVGRSVLWLPARAGIAPLSAPRRLSRPPPPGVLAAALRRGLGGGRLAPVRRREIGRRGAGAQV